nr:hypothetical protein [uncultured Treponema sp.]
MNTISGITIGDAVSCSLQFLTWEGVTEFYSRQTYRVDTDEDE